MAAPSPISRTNFRHMYWNARQQLVHHTITGCAMRPGDLLGSGTISGPVSEGAVGALVGTSTRPPSARTAGAWVVREHARAGVEGDEARPAP